MRRRRPPGARLVSPGAFTAGVSREAVATAADTCRASWRRLMTRCSQSDMGRDTPASDPRGRERSARDQVWRIERAGANRLARIARVAHTGHGASNQQRPRPPILQDNERWELGHRTRRSGGRWCRGRSGCRSAAVAHRQAPSVAAGWSSVSSWRPIRAGLRAATASPLL